MSYLDLSQNKKNVITSLAEPTSEYDGGCKLASNTPNVNGDRRL